MRVEIDEEAAMRELAIYGNVFYQQTLDGLRWIPRAEWDNLAEALKDAPEEKDA